MNVVPRRRAGRHRRPGPAERRQRLRPPDLPRPGRAGLVGARARGARLVAAAGRGGASSAGPASSRRIRDGAVVLVDGLIASTVAGRAACPQARPAAAGRARAHAAGRRALAKRARAAGRRPAPSSRPASGRRDRCSTGTRFDRDGCTSPSRASTPPRSRPARAGGAELLCVAAVTPDKGHDVLLAALAAIADLPWRCAASAARPRPGLRRRAAPAGRRRRHRRPGALRRPADRADTRRRVRRRRPAGAGLARRDVRHGRHRGAGPRAAGDRDRGRRGARGARARRRREPARPAGAARRPGRARRRAARLAATTPALRQRGCGRPRRRPAASTLPRRGATTTAESDRAGVLDARRRRDRRRPVRVSPAWLALREPADAAARAADLVDELRPAICRRRRSVIHDLGCGTGSMGRWLAPRCPARSTGSCTTATPTCSPRAAPTWPPAAADGHR